VIVTLQGGDGRGVAAAVDTTGSVQTSVANTVTTKRATLLAVYRTTATVGTSSGELLAARTGRRGLWVQNHHATNSVRLRFEGLDATSDDWLLPPGGELRAEDLGYEGAVRAIASGADTNVLALEFA